MVWESAGESTAVGLTCCNHQTEKSLNRLLRRGVSCRIAADDKFVFIENSLFPPTSHNSDQYGDPSVEIN